MDSQASDVGTWPRTGSFYFCGVVSWLESIEVAASWVTPIGKRLRSLKLDEPPQLLAT
jgi:lipopolysaccharide/colanic/teichoic acid biosynthesis glycosyltransferase